MSMLSLDAQALYADLLSGVRSMLRPNTALVGIWSGGAWLAERLQQDLGLPGEPGVLSSALHRDDFGQRGLAVGTDQTRLPFDIEGRDLLLIDDVLYTGRTIRAAINELFDFGRPASVRLAVLVDRGGRELPIEAGYSAARVTLPIGSAFHSNAKTRACSAFMSKPTSPPANDGAHQLPDRLLTTDPLATARLPISATPRC